MQREFEPCLKRFSKSNSADTRVIKLTYGDDTQPWLFATARGARKAGPDLSVRDIPGFSLRNLANDTSQQVPPGTKRAVETHQPHLRKKHTEV